jgi:hypothetical protein
MSDIIYYKNGEETFRISPPTLGTKCPETKLEIKMTETDISKVLIEGDYATIMGVKYKRVKEQEFTLELTLDELHMLDKYVEYCEETKEFFDKLKNAYPKQKSPVEEAYKNTFGDYPDMVHNLNSFSIFQKGYEAAQPKDTEPYCPDEPDWYDEVEWDEKDNPKPMDEVVNKMLKKWEENPPEFLKFELGKTLETLITRWWCDVFTTREDWDMETAIDDLIDQIQLWLPKSQSASGSQSLGVEDMVEGFNDCLKKIKSKLRNKR